MGIFISWQKTVECVAIALFFTAAVAAISYKLVAIMQSSAYRGKKFCAWLNKKSNLALARLSLLAFLCLTSSAVIALCFSFADEWAALCSLAAFVIFFIVYIVADRKIALRCPANRTPRFMRLYTVYILIFAIVAYIAITLLNFADNVWGNALFSALRYVPLAVLPLIAIPVLLLANLICKVYEVPHNKNFIKKAKKKIAGSKITVVGITGSYGKTSTKIILTEILKKKFRVLSTPRSHNTPMGLALSINNNDLENYDIFVAEMGARHSGDIAELCDICPPDYSVITGVCGQHLQTFGTFDAVVRAKGEILAGTKHTTFVAADCYDLYSANARAQKCDEPYNIVCSPEGIEFDITLGKPVHAKCKLLGAHAAGNIALAARIAYALGMTGEEIVEGIAGLDFIEHRLQLIKSGGVNILDDGYNANVKGARAALSVLRLFGGRKIVVTPGLVELGVLEDEENYALGCELAGFDGVILVGDTLVAPVKRGYLDKGGDAEKITVVPTLSRAQEKLKETLADGDTVLFLNDLPDVY